MKKTITFLPVIMLFAVIMIIAGTGTDKGSLDNRFRNTVMKLHERFDQSFFFSVFSLEEIRNYSIIQTDNTLQLYLSNDDISPKLLAEALSEQDKDILVSKIADYAMTLSSIQEAENFFKRIEYWCIADQLFTLMNGKMGFYAENLKNAVKRIEETKRIFSQFDRSNSAHSDDDQNLSDDQQYFELLNYLSKLSFDQQLEYYSDVYHELSLMSKES